MEEKVLGKITSAEFGQSKDRPFLFGLQLGFKLKGGGIHDGGKYTCNISSACKWEYNSDREEAFMNQLDKLNQILNDAAVSYVSELIGKPVEITIVDNQFKDFRILTEVI